MVCHELAVEERVATGLQASDEPGEGDLRCIGRAAEHAFAEEGSAELDAIEAADELVTAPDFDRMGVAEPVQREYCALDIGVDPGFRPVGAGSDDLGECHVEGNPEPVRPDRSPERV